MLKTDTMKKTTCYLLLNLFLFVSYTQAQDLDAKWSSKTKYTNRDEGYFQKYVGSNKEYVYATYTDFKNLTLNRRKKSKLVLVAFDKLNMQKSYQFYLKDKKRDQKRYKKLQNFTYLNTLVVKNTIYVFWKKNSLTQTEIYAESFDSYLNAKERLKKVYLVKHEASKKINRKKQNKEFLGQALAIPITLQISPDSASIFIGVEIEKQKKDFIEFDYAILNLDFSEVNKGHVSLPAIPTRWYSYLSNAFTYKLGKDGNIYIKGNVSYTQSERRKSKKDDNAPFSILCVLDPASSALETYTVKFDGMNISNFDLISNENGAKLYGFFSDLSKDAKGNKTHGIFYSTITNGEISEPHFSYFDAQTLTELFKEDPNDQFRDGTTSQKRNKLKNVNKDESIDEKYVIETVESIDDEHIVLFCTKVYNYSTITTITTGFTGGSAGGFGGASGFGGAGRTVTPSINYYCKKSNVTAFKLNNEGEIVWASNLDREKTYKNWDVKDLKIVHDEEKFYVLYGSAFHTDSLRLSGKKAKKGKELRDELEYGIFDYETGKAEKGNYVINAPSVGRKDRKFVDPEKIQVFDNKFYVNDLKLRLKPIFIILPVSFMALGSLMMLEQPWFFIAGFAGVLGFTFTVPISMIFYANGNAFKGSGYVGSIELSK